MPTAADAKDMMVERFGQLVYEFLDAATEVWPQCETLKAWKADYDDKCTDPRRAKVFTEVILAEFIRDYKPFFARIEEKDITLFSEPLPLFLKGKVSAKYEAASDAVRDTCWQHATQIVQAARMTDVYGKCPTDMLNRVAGMANDIVADLEAGRLDVSKLNPMELTQKMMANIDMKEMEKWGRTMAASGDMESFMSLATSVMGGGSGNPLSSIAGALGGGGAGIDPNLLASMIKGDNFFKGLMEKDDEK